MSDHIKIGVKSTKHYSEVFLHFFLFFFQNYSSRLSWHWAATQVGTCCLFDRFLTCVIPDEFPRSFSLYLVRRIFITFNTLTTDGITVFVQSQDARSHTFLEPLKSRCLTHRRYYDWKRKEWLTSLPAENLGESCVWADTVLRFFNFFFKLCPWHVNGAPIYILA